MTLKHSVLAGVTVFSFAVAAPSAVSAHEGHMHTTQSTTEERPATTEKRTVEQRTEAVQTKLAAAKLKACQNRQKAITNIMTRMTERAEKRVALFDSIAERAKHFYETKGKTLENYDALVADVVAKKAAVQAQIDAAKSTTTSFNCDSADPKGAVSGFKDTAKTGREALQAYRTSVKNLIAGIKSVQGTNSSERKVNDGTAQ